MHDELLAIVLAEVDGLLRTVGVRGQSVRVIACDAAAHTAQRVRSASQVQLIGGGGTNMGAGIDAAIELRPRPSVIVVLTDGYTPWPPNGPAVATVIVGLLGGALAPEPPAWARVVHIDES
jgi:predicted metal-dependent peptidase